MIFYSFFEQRDFAGKTIISFNTHGGSGFSNTISRIMQLEPMLIRNYIQDGERDIIA